MTEKFSISGLIGKPRKILITGASGLIGTRLTQLLLEGGHEVSHLGRGPGYGRVPSYKWNIEKEYIDPSALSDVDCIVHLAGAGVADKRWTNQRKKEILDSRVKSTKLLCRDIQKGAHRVNAVVCASAIGYYGMDAGEKLSVETDEPGSGFLTDVVTKWEEAAEEIGRTGMRLVKMRIGIPLSAGGGALKAMATPVRLGFGAPLGNGKQFMSWIHIDDLCRMFMQAILDERMNGVYNAVGLSPVTNGDLTKAIAKVLGKTLWLPPVPGFVLKLMLGEMAEIVIASNRVSCDKIRRTGFQFQFDELEPALKDLLTIRDHNQP